jgi:hypothetical protein
MFVQPMYCGILLDQSLILNRRKYEDNTKGLDEKVAFVLHILMKILVWVIHATNKAFCSNMESPLIALFISFYNKIINYCYRCNVHFWRILHTGNNRMTANYSPHVGFFLLCIKYNTAGLVLYFHFLVESWG